MAWSRLSVGGLLLVGCLLARVGVSGQQPAEQSVKGFRAEPGLEVRLWAAEPALTNPTNIAVDERGRVWVLEAVNYRRLLRGQPDLRPAGDRIVILEDSDGDGDADKSTVFDQSPALRAPLGIAVLGNRVIVSQSPDLIVYTKDAADRIVKKEVLLTGWGGVDHDHGLHAVVFGPDGRYYFNAGNEGYDVTDRAGQRVRAAKPAGFRGPAEPRQPGDYLEGAVMSVRPDGTDLRVLAQNFRNPYEVALDAFGNLWQTDNDDDGNAWTRANYVMEGGNYGFRGPYARTWREDTGTHFHEELPGVAPNMLRLGPGSPCGLLVYEGLLLPPAQRGQLLHAEAGRRLVARYPIEAAGAGYTTRVDEVVVGGAETWFRPSDVAVGPDGAVYIADWYDPAVGGHGMGDLEGARGRIYRLAPPGHRSRVPTIDLRSNDGLTNAFRSPAQAVYFLAHEELVRRGPAALPLLTTMWRKGDAVLRARALWLIGALGGDGAALVRRALGDADPRFRVLALRIASRGGADMIQTVWPLLRDPSPQVRREIALLLQDRDRMTPPYLVGAQTTPSPALLAALVELAMQYDGEDRWYLEALGIAARGREDALYAALRPRFPAWTSAWSRLQWELRAPSSFHDLIDVVTDRARDLTVRQAALDVVAAMHSPEAARAMGAAVVDPTAPAPLVARAFAHLRRQLFSMWSDARGTAAVDAVVRHGLATPALQPLAVELATALGDAQYLPQLLSLARTTAVDAAVRAAALDAVAIVRDPQYLAEFERLTTDASSAVQVSAVHGIGLLAPPDVETQARDLLVSDVSSGARAEALRILARTPRGIYLLLELELDGRFPPEQRTLAATLINGPVRRQGFGPRRRAGEPPPSPAAIEAELAALTSARERAAKVFPPPVTITSASIPTIRQMEQNFRTDAAAGRQVFETMCASCHALGGERRLGPDLSAIGLKLDRQALLDALVTPSASIAFGYESWAMDTTTQGSVTGLLVENTPQRVTLRVDATQEIRLLPSEITARRPVPVSMMPDVLINVMTPQQIADLITFLSGLRGQQQ